MTIEAIIVDDEPLAVDGIRRFCAASGVIDIVGVAHEAKSARQLISTHRPQAAFLDIAMPGCSGLELAADLAKDPNSPRIVLVTAHDHFATEAFDLAVLDYVLKPLEPQRLLRAIDRLQTALSPSAAGLDRGGADLWVPYRGTVKRLPPESIIQLKAERDYVRLYDRTSSYLLRSTLTELLDRLGPSFVRVHRSVALRLDRISALRHVGGGAWEVIAPSGDTTPVGRRYLNALRDRLCLCLPDIEEESDCR